MDTERPERRCEEMKVCRKRSFEIWGTIPDLSRMGLLDLSCQTLKDLVLGCVRSRILEHAVHSQSSGHTNSIRLKLVVQSSVNNHIFYQFCLEIDFFYNVSLEFSVFFSDPYFVARE